MTDEDSCGCEFVGYRIWTTHVVLRKRTTLHIKRSLRKIMDQYHDYEITMEDAFASLQSYLGMFCHCDSHSLQEKILEEFVLTHGNRIFTAEEYEYFIGGPYEEG
jgi:hypothetical protein